jgi:hypothetical protein
MNLISNKDIAFIVTFTALCAGLATARAESNSEIKIVPMTHTLIDDEDQSTGGSSSSIGSASAGGGGSGGSGSSSAANPITATLGITIQSIEPDAKAKRTREVAWLGVAVEEAPEALSAQLAIKPGEGLVISMVASDSPAAKADLQKNDVLVDLDGQMLVHPIQLRKLVQMHAEGDPVKVTFFRGGKKQTISTKLGKTLWEEADDTDTSPSHDDLQIQLDNLQRLSGDMHGLKESLQLSGLDKDKVKLEIDRTMEQTRKALRDAVQQAAVSDRALRSVNRDLESLARRGVDVDRDATVIVKNKSSSSKTIVETDDRGTYIIEAGEKTHLTARDKHGKLLFDGEIDTPAQQAKVPKEVWEKAKTMMEQIATPNTPDPKSEDKSEEKPNSRNKLPAAVSYECA